MLEVRLDFDYTAVLRIPLSACLSRRLPDIDGESL